MRMVADRHILVAHTLLLTLSLVTYFVAFGHYNRPCYLLIMTSTADDLSGGTNIDNLE